MVLGIGTKNKKGGGTSSVQADYLIHVLEIKPWPPSQSLKSVRSVLLQWEYGARYSGTFDPVIPSLGGGGSPPSPPPGAGAGAGGVGNNNNNNIGNIEFNESFRLPVTLTREASVKGVASEVYQRNFLLFNLYEPRRDKTVKGQLLGTVTINLAELGIVRETVFTSASVNCKRSFRNATQPLLYIKIQPFDKHGSSRDSLSEASSLDRNDKESVSALMNDEYADEAAEIASFTDDDVSSHSSLAPFEATGSSPPQINDHENTLEEAVKNSTGESTGVPGSPPLEQVTVKSEVNTVIAAYKHLNESSSPSSSVDLPLGEESPENDHASLSNFHERGPTLVTRKFATDSVQSPLSSIVYEGTEENILCNNNNTKSAGLDSTHKVQENIVNGGSTSTEEALQSAVPLNKTNNLVAKVASSDSNLLVSEKSGIVISADSQFNGEEEGKARAQNRSGPEEASSSTLGLEYGLVEDKDVVKCEENGQKELAEKDKECVVDGEPLPIMGDTLAFSKRDLGVNYNFFTNSRLRHVKSVRSLQDTARGNGTTGNNQLRGEVHEPETFEEAHRFAISSVNGEGKESSIVSSGARSSISDSKAREYKRRIEKLERELREAAAIEVALYSIVAEHGSSVNKVHAPARRLSRLYLHASKEGSQVSRASAARSAVSGLVLVAKACGNDVPRLTFWLSNSIVLRAIINLGLGDSQLPISAGPHVGSNGGGKGNDKRSSSLKWKKTSLKKKENNLSFAEDFDDWEDPLAFTSALEKIEAWIFSRIVESIWWQTLTPHMQPTSRKANEQKSLKKNYVRKSSLRDEDQANFSLDLWKNAFNDACERLCPVRASGHECGCLPVLARLVMEQCVHRLDVAMFNAILRESADDIPTDPISDPISDSKVLPIPSGKSSFGSGAQLKNVIGNWSRWLTDLFGLDDDDIHQDDNEIDAYDREEPETSSKLFHLLHALSDLMMLPKDMLLNKSIRKEVCPTFGAPLIKRVLHNFVPDEFCPDPIPEIVLETLDTEDSPEAEEDEEVIRNFPHNVTPVAYSPPSAALLVNIIGKDGKESSLMRRSNSVLRKSYWSDDELDELDSPLTSIIIDSAPPSPIAKLTLKQNGSRDTVRYQLLREVWRDED